MSEVLRTGKSWIQKTPGVIGGDACIRNTRIAVWMLVEGRHLGMSDQRLLQAHPAHPSLTQADLDIAWEYCLLVRSVGYQPSPSWDLGNDRRSYAPDNLTIVWV
jgi:uncharacterized protein (DUF433 family)